MAFTVNFVFNYCNGLGLNVFDRERRFLSDFDLQSCLPAGRRRVRHASPAVQEIKPRWRVSNLEHLNYSLGWIPFKARSLINKAGQVVFQGIKLSLWDSYVPTDCALGSGNISEDARGR